MPDWRINRYRGKLALVFERDGQRHRHSLGTDDKGIAERLAPALFAELNRPKGSSVAELWQGYVDDRHGRAILATMEHTFKALKDRFGGLPGEQVTIADCRAHTAARRKAGIKDGTIHTELGHLRMVLTWAAENKLIGHAPKIERPSKPPARDRHLTKDEAIRLIAAAKAPHIKTAIHLLLATAGRITAVLELTWDRVHFDRRQIHLRDPNDKTRRKGRAVVPITDTLFAVLRDAKEGAWSDYVIEWAGQPVKSIKRGIASAAAAADLPDVTPHVFRHTTAVWLAEGGTPMSEIAQYLGHSDTRTTEKVYARYSPEHLRQAASHLELGFNVVPAGTAEPQKANRRRT